MRQSVAQWAGWGGDGGPLIDTHISVPDRIDRDGDATERQVSALRRAYGEGIVSEGLTFGQAHSLLNWREFALAFAEHLPDTPIMRMMPTMLVSYMSETPVLGWKVDRYMDDRFNRGADPDKLGRSIKRLPWTDELLRFVEDVQADMAEMEATFPPLLKAE